MDAKVGIVTETPSSVSDFRTLDMEVKNTHSYQIMVGPCVSVVTHNTLSLLGNCTAGCHPGIYKNFIRRIRMSSDTPLVDICKKHGYVVEDQLNFDGTIDHSTQIPCFPCKYPDGTILAKNFDAIKQMDIVRRLQSEWSDNSVSCTVYYKPDELPAIKEYLKQHFENGIKSISFMLHQEHGFKQAPYEEITRDQFEAMSKKVTPINSAAIKFYKSDDTLASEPTCAGGVCPIK
jgi:ribonucleoside-diphosphate reductase alpha chain/ribonucleoside-triphosphate reductase